MTIDKYIKDEYTDEEFRNLLNKCQEMHEGIKRAQLSIVKQTWKRWVPNAFFAKVEGWDYGHMCEGVNLAHKNRRKKGALKWH